MQQGVDYVGVSAGTMLLNDKGEVFLSKRSRKSRNERGHWETPGGSVEFGETLAETAKREMMEEYGVEIEIIERFPAYDHLLPDEKQHWVATTFLAHLKSGQVPKIMEPDKCDAIGWFALDKLPVPLSRIAQADLREYKKRQVAREPEVYKAGGILIQDRKTLVGRSHGKEVFISPGGKIETGETPRQALVRELNEEFQIEVDESDLEPFGTFSAEAAGQPGRVVHIEHFIVKKWRGEVRPDNEVEALRWITSKLPPGFKLGSIFEHEIMPRLKKQGLID